MCGLLVGTLRFNGLLSEGLGILSGSEAPVVDVVDGMDMVGEVEAGWTAGRRNEGCE